MVGNQQYTDCVAMLTDEEAAPYLDKRFKGVVVPVKPTQAQEAE